jgi:hypothetical protein
VTAAHLLEDRDGLPELAAVHPGDGVHDRGVVWIGERLHVELLGRRRLRRGGVLGGARRCRSSAQRRQNDG